MNKSIRKISFILIFIGVFICNVNCQQIANYANNDSITFLEDVNISYDYTIDTTGLKIIYVLEMEGHNNGCGSSHFIVMFNDSSAVYFNMGCDIYTQKVYWLSMGDTLYFYTQEINKKIKVEGLKQPKQIAGYIVNHIFEDKDRLHGEIGLNIDYLVQDTPDHYRAFIKSNMTGLSFKKENSIRDCNMRHYHDIIRKNKILENGQICAKEKYYENKRLKAIFWDSAGIRVDSSKAECLANFLNDDINKFRLWVAQNLNYPPIAAEVGIWGKLIIQFSIDTSGYVCDVKVLKSLHPIMEKAAIKTIMSSPKWNSVRQNNRLVKQKFALPIVFEIK
jgi:TonB family protein